jgi:hypothetical protein
MTVENDGLPPSEGAAHQPDDVETLDPPTELLPLDAADATKAAAADAAARQAELNMPVGPVPPADQATQVLPLDHRAEPPEPAPDTATEGSLEGDLFDGT